MTREHLERSRQQQFIDQMVSNGYEYFGCDINYSDILDNFKKQLEINNQIELSNDEFRRILNKMDMGSITDKSITLKKGNDGRIEYQKDDNDMANVKIFNSREWCKNNFQIAQEIHNHNPRYSTVKNEYLKARFDVMIFINGIPMVSFEFKQSSISEKEAYEQIVNYKNNNQYYGLLEYIQIFFASNFVNTIYFANNMILDKNFTFNWTDEQNVIMGNIFKLADDLLTRCSVAEMIARFMIEGVNKAPNIILRPYQVYAAKNILNCVKENNGNGYIFHTTGSGKTITSFKTCRILTRDERIDQVIFLVDRKDLDAQTKKSYEGYEPGSYEGANNVQHLKKQILKPDGKKIVVATIQKLGELLKPESKRLSANDREFIKSRRYVVIIDECHRSQSGDTTKNLREILSCDGISSNTQYFGFTGTPIFDLNKNEDKKGLDTTKNLFHKELHRYTITDAIRDNNVLKFKCQTRLKDGVNYDPLDETRISAAAHDVLSKFLIFTHNKAYNTIFACQSREQLELYYKYLKLENEKLVDEDKLNITAVFSTKPDDEESKFSDEFKDLIIGDYNKMRKTNIQLEDVDSFKSSVYNDVRNRDIDIVLVIDMLLTGFDSPITNTLFVDKKMKYHKLLQAYSRTNRLYKSKPFGTIVTYLDQREERDIALELFAAGGSYGEIEMDDAVVIVDRLNHKITLQQSLVAGGSLKDLLSKPKNLKEALQYTKEILKDYDYLRSHPDNENCEGLSLSRVEMMDLKREFFEVSKKLSSDKQIDFDDEDVEKVKLEFDFELDFFNEVEINYNYLYKFIRENLDNEEAIVEHIRSQGMPSRREVIMKNITHEYLNEKSEENPSDYFEKKFSEYILTELNSLVDKHDIIDPDGFVKLAFKQMDGQLKTSDSSNYIEYSREKSFPQKMKFKKQVFDEVAEIDEVYRFTS